MLVALLFGESGGVSVVPPKSIPAHLIVNGPTTLYILKKQKGTNVGVVVRCFDLQPGVSVDIGRRGPQPGQSEPRDKFFIFGVVEVLSGEVEPNEITK